MRKVLGLIFVGVITVLAFAASFDDPPPCNPRVQICPPR